MMFDKIIAKEPERNILLLMDNFSDHCTKETLPTLTHVVVEFLPPNKTIKLEPFNAGIIAAMKVQYRRLQMDHSVDHLDFGVMNSYKNDILTSTLCFSTIWNEIGNDVIRNFWDTTSIVPAYD